MDYYPTSATQITLGTPATPVTPAAPITIDGDMSDWANITSVYKDDSKSRIREWWFKSDADNVYFLFKVRKNRADKSRELFIVFDTDNNAATGTSHGSINGGESYIYSIPFTNEGEGTQPVCVNGSDPQGKINDVADATSIVVFMEANNQESLSSSESNLYFELSIPRAKLNLPAAGNSITVGCSFNWYTTSSESVTLE